MALVTSADSTDSSPPRSMARRWCFTLNNYAADELSGIRDRLTTDLCHAAIVSTETAPSTGTPHLQGYVYMKKPIRLAALKKLISKNIHGEMCKGTHGQNFDYCPKDGGVLIDFGRDYDPKRQKQESDKSKLTLLIELVAAGAHWSELEAAGVHMLYATRKKYVDGVVHSDRDRAKTQEDKKGLMTATLYKWQKELMDILSQEPDSRSVYWRWDPTGDTGKSWFAYYLMTMCDAAYFDSTKKTDITFAYRNQRIVVFDIPRSGDLEKLYPLVESFKNRVFFSNKYESCTKKFKVPHVVVFSNHAPNFSALSADRWRVRQIQEEDCVMCE